MDPKSPSAPDLGAALASASCPVPAPDAQGTILLAHGGGGRLTQRLIEALDVLLDKLWQGAHVMRTAASPG